jgi:tripeptide aminopeptidase
MALARSILTIAFVAIAQQVWAQAPAAPDIEAILAHPKVVKTLDDIKADDERAFAEQ